MAAAKEIRTKIASVKSTQKITSAMEMVAASKMRKAQDRMEATRPYAEKMRQVIGHVALANPEYKHPFMHSREVKRIGFIIVSSDRGLCGGLNNNLFRSLIRDIRELRNQGVEVEYCTIGTKALGFFRRVGGKVAAQATHLFLTSVFGCLIASSEPLASRRRDLEALISLYLSETAG